MILKYSSVVSMLGDISLGNRHYLENGQRLYGIQLASADLGIFWIRRLLEDGLVSSDAVVSSFIKVLAETTAATDYQQIIASKKLGHRNTVHGHVAWQLDRGIKDAPTVSDIVGLHPRKPFAEALSVLSVPLINTLKNLASTAAIGEVYRKETGKGLQENMGVADAFGFLTRARHNEPVVALDQPAFSAAKRLFSGVGITDDFNGTAVAGDDQSIHFDKGLTDPVNFSEVLVLTLLYGRRLGDSAGVSDVFRLWVNSLLYFNKVRVLEVFSAIIQKIQKESVNINDLSRVSIHKGLIDTNTAADSLRMVFSVMRRMQESVGVVDSGRINKQSYVASGNYFAEDFVGESYVIN